MKASELIEDIQRMIEMYGDREIVIDDIGDFPTKVPFVAYDEREQEFYIF